MDYLTHQNYKNKQIKNNILELENFLSQLIYLYMI